MDDYPGFAYNRFFPDLQGPIAWLSEATMIIADLKAQTENTEIRYFSTQQSHRPSRLFDQCHGFRRSRQY